MSLKVVSILIFALSLTSIRCEDWCSLIKPNGSYEGLGMYRHFKVNTKELGTYHMYNRAGTEWMFEIDYSDNQYSLKMKENSTKESDQKDVVLRYGFYLGHRSSGLKDSVFDCTVKTVVKSL